MVLPKVILAMKSSKLLNLGTWSILASVVDVREIKVTLTSEPGGKRLSRWFSKGPLGIVTA